MVKNIAHRRKGFTPLPIRDGLNPTRARVPAEEAGISAWDFIWHLVRSQRHRHPEDNEAAVDRRFAAGEVVLRDTTPLAPETPLAAEQDVWFYRTPAIEEEVPYDITVIHEDENLLVADKPPFMATMPRAKHIVQTATVQLRRITGIQELSPAHRLDRLTSGILVFTKTREVRGAYQTLFAERRVEKTYEAIAERRDFETPLLWETRIEKTPGEIQGRLVDGPINAITTLAAVEQLNEGEQELLNALHGPLAPQARYVLRPKTGKTHQLRLHMWRAGVPILGDPVYPVIYPAEAEDMSIPMHLTARHIAFIDPITDKPREFWTQRHIITPNS